MVRVLLTEVNNQGNLIINDIKVRPLQITICYVRTYGNDMQPNGMGQWALTDASA